MQGGALTIAWTFAGAQFELNLTKKSKKKKKEKKKEKKEAPPEPAPAPAEDAKAAQEARLAKLSSGPAPGVVSTSPGPLAAICCFTISRAASTAGDTFVVVCLVAAKSSAVEARATHAMDAIRSAREGVGRADATGAREVSPARMLDAGRGRNCRATRETRRERRLVVSASARE